MNGRSPHGHEGTDTGQPGIFSTTHWSVVLEAGQTDSAGALAALERLCRTYWYPLYVFIRKKGYSPEDAQDLTQEFFARFLEKQYVGLADQSRGKFRTFLLRSLEHFLINEWAKTQAAKRGGGIARSIPLDEEEPEKRYLLERVDGMAPDKAYEKRWAISLLEKVMERLRAEFAPQRSDLFDALKVTVWGEQTEASYQLISASLGMAEGAVKVAAHRMRLRYRELLRSEVAHTVATSAAVDEELQYLAGVLRS
jgi:RNA polymerase sigma-70 factor (ECF subfamily)